MANIGKRVRIEDVFKVGRIDAVVDYLNLFSRNLIAFHDKVLGRLTDCHDPIGHQETGILDFVHQFVAGAPSGSVELGSVDVSHQRNIQPALGGYGRFVGQPVVGVDQIILLFVQQLVD